MCPTGTGGYVPGAGDLYMKPRLPLGKLTLSIVGAVGNETFANAIGEFRIRLREARVTASLHWPASDATVSLSAFAPHMHPSGLVLEANSTGVEVALDFTPAVSQTTRHGPPAACLPNPPATEVGGNPDEPVWAQRLLAGGGLGHGHPEAGEWARRGWADHMRHRHRERHAGSDECGNRSDIGQGDGGGRGCVAVC